MTYSLTIFKSIFDNKTHRKMDFATWKEFEDMLYGLSTKKAIKPAKGEFVKNPAPLISSARYAENTTRANDNVIEWAGWCAMDIDEYEGDWKAVVERYTRYQFICYSTGSSTKEHPKFRMVLPLTQPVPQDKIKHFWHALNHKFGGVIDGQTKDLSRMFYIPGKYPGAYNFIFSNDGEHLNPQDLIDSYEFVEPKKSSFLDRLPPELQEKVLQFRKEKMSRDATWTGYTDCPFVPQRLVTEYKAIAGHDGTGRYAMIYKIMTAIACNAVKKNFAISAHDIASMIRELDRDTANRYQSRPLEIEANRAIEFAYRNVNPLEYM